MNIPQMRWLNVRGPVQTDMMDRIKQEWPTIVACVLRAAGEKNLLAYQKTAHTMRRGAFTRFEDLPAITEENLLGELSRMTFTFKQRTRTGRTNATAHYSSGRVSFNPISLAQWVRDYTPEGFVARIVDLTLHEIGHLLAYRFHGRAGTGHGMIWRTWGRVIHYTPIGSTDPFKKLARSLKLQPKRIFALDTLFPTPTLAHAAEEIPMQTQTTSDLSNLSVADLRSRAEGLGLTLKDARRANKGKTPTKASWIEIITNAQASAPVKRHKRDEQPPVLKKAGKGTIWRVATLTNPNTGRSVTLKLCSDGRILPSDQKRVGLEYAPEWDEVRAESMTEAKAKIAAGDCIHHTR